MSSSVSSEITAFSIQPATSIGVKQSTNKSTFKGVLCSVVGHDAIVAEFGVALTTTLGVVVNLSTISEVSEIPASALRIAAIGLGGYLGIKGCLAISNIGYRNAEYHLGAEKLEIMNTVIKTTTAASFLLKSLNLI